MKKKNIKKRLAAFGLGLMLSLSVISPFYVQAGTGATSSYGSYEISNLNLDIFSTNISMYSFEYNLNGSYNGRFQIHFNQTVNTSSVNLLLMNCYVESYINLNTIQIAFKNVSEIGFFIWGAFSSSLSITGIDNYNMTRITDGVNTQLQSLSMAISDIEQTLNTVESRQQTINSNVSLINTSVDNIESDVDAMNANILAIKNQLRSYFTNSGGTTVTIGDINLSLNYIDSLLDAQLVVQAGIETKLADVLTAINNIDNQIDTITWINLNKTINLDPAPSTNWTNISNNTLYIEFPNNIAVPNYSNVIYKLIVPVNVNNFNTDVSIELQVGNNHTVINDAILYHYYNNFETTIFFRTSFDVGATNNRIVIKSTDSNLRYTRPDNISSNISYIVDSDIEYWQLLNSFKTFNNFATQKDYYNNTSSQLTAILNAINTLDLSVNIDQHTQTEINNYNQYLDDMDLEIDLQLNPFRDNKNTLLTALQNLPAILITPADKFYHLITDYVIVQNTGSLFSLYLKIMLFALLVGVMLG